MTKSPGTVYSLPLESSLLLVFISTFVVTTFYWEINIFLLDVIIILL